MTIASSSPDMRIDLHARHTSEMKTWIDDLYLEIKARWNRIRALPDTDTDECAFLVHLMEEIEKCTDK